MYDLAVENNKFICVPPRQLKKKDIDWKMRPICDRINASDYCWTVFCCQGHLSGNQKGGLPYLVLLCVNDKRPHIFETLFKCFEYDLAYEKQFFNAKKNKCISLRIVAYLFSKCTMATGR